MSTVYVLHHIHVADDGGEEDVKLIGIYETAQDAESAVVRLRVLPGFRDHPDGFEITGYELNKDHWTEGFISWEEAADPVV